MFLDISGFWGRVFFSGFLRLHIFGALCISFRTLYLFWGLNVFGLSVCVFEGPCVCFSGSVCGFGAVYFGAVYVWGSLLDLGLSARFLGLSACLGAECFWALCVCFWGSPCVFQAVYFWGCVFLGPLCVFGTLCLFFRVLCLF